jgi:hypothetical protein
METTQAARPLGVIEAISAARDQCPNAAVREHAARALEAIREGGPEALNEQAFLVFSTLAGWRGERADQVRRSLRDFLADSAPREA